MSINQNQDGLFISFEGIEGVGKSTNIRFAADLLNKRSIQAFVSREPGGTLIAEKIREIFIQNQSEEVLPETELLLLYAGRKQHVEHVIKPEIKNGTWVLCDRFADATRAYQGGGRQIPLDKIEALHQWTLGDFKPDKTVFFDAPVEVGMQRIQSRQNLDRIEKEELAFFERVRETYQMLAEKEPSRFVVIDASQSLEEVQNDLEKHMVSWITQR